MNKRWTNCNIHSNPIEKERTHPFYLRQVVDLDAETLIASFDKQVVDLDATKKQPLVQPLTDSY